MVILRSSSSGGGEGGLVLLHFAADNSLKLKFKIYHYQKTYLRAIFKCRSLRGFQKTTQPNIVYPPPILHRTFKSLPDSFRSTEGKLLRVGRKHICLQTNRQSSQMFISRGKQLVIQHIVICTREIRKPTPKCKCLQTFAIFLKLYPVVLISCLSTQNFCKYLTLTCKTI